MEFAGKNEFAAGSESHQSLKSRALTLAIFLITVLCVSHALVTNPYEIGEVAGGYRIAHLAAMTSPLIFVLACIQVLVRPRFGYGLGLVGGLMALPWFIWTEWAFHPWADAWTAFNIARDGELFLKDQPFVDFAEFKIVSIALILLSVLCASLRLIPAKWTFRKSPWRHRSWPAFAVCFVLMSFWFVSSVWPYRLPMIVDGVPPSLRILHVQKRGLQFHELEVMTYRDGRFWVSQNDRKLFQYRFQDRTGQGIMPPDIGKHAHFLIQSTDLSEMRTASPEALRSWDAEGWYVVVEGRVLAFSSEYKTVPPKEVLNLFNEIEGLPANTKTSWPVQDVCLGFCYDPLAGLGFTYANNRCFTNLDGRTQCR